MRVKYLQDLSEHTKRDTILYAARLGSDNYRAAVSEPDIQGFMSALHGLNGEHLDIILHSHGGDPYVTTQIGNYLHQKYDHIRAIVPQTAMSAATMLACACDEIIMGKHSAIGPIDPQILMHGAHGGPPRYVAAQSIIEEFERAREEIIANSGNAAVWYPVLNYPAGFLTDAQKSIDGAERQVQSWLAAHMFGGLHDLRASKVAKNIAQWLAKGDHKVHAHPININEAKRVGLKVTPLEKNQKLQERVLSVFHTMAITFEA